MKAATADKVREIVQAHRDRTGSEEHVYLGRRVSISPQVFSPFIAPSGYLSFALSSLPLFTNKRILDVGCGAGIFASAVGSSGADRVVGIDINEHAVNDAAGNAKALGVARRTEFRQGSLFEPLERGELFDLVFADLPFTNGEPRDLLERAFYDKDLALIKEFMRGVPDRLNGPGAEVYLCISDADHIKLGPLARAARLRYEPFIRVKLPWMQLFLLRMQRD